jgi:hypothetical protein
VKPDGNRRITGSPWRSLSTGTFFQPPTPRHLISRKTSKVIGSSDTDAMSRRRDHHTIIISRTLSVTKIAKLSQHDFIWGAWFGCYFVLFVLLASSRVGRAPRSRSLHVLIRIHAVVSMKNESLSTLDNTCFSYFYISSS